MRTTTVVIGAGHSGLAMSKCLSDRSIDHVVTPNEAKSASSWRTEPVLGLAALAHAELAMPPSRIFIRGQRLQRLHEDGRGRRLHHELPRR